VRFLAPRTQLDKGHYQFPETVLVLAGSLMGALTQDHPDS